MNAFIIMPFKEELDQIYDLFIAEILDESGFDFKRADNIKSQQNILKDIVVGISQSDLVIAELTNPNPNVYYELGLAHAMNKPVISLTQDISQLPFDLKSYRVIQYDSHFAEIRKAKKEFQTLLEDFKEAKVPFSNPVSDFLGKDFSSLSNYSSSNTAQKEFGFLDHLVEIENYFKELNEVTLDIADSTHVIADKTREATAKIKRATANGPSQAATIRIRKISQSLAKDYNEYSSKIQESNPKYQQVNSKIKSSLDFIFNFIDKNVKDYDEKSLIEAKESFLNLEKSLIEAQDNLEGYQQNLKNLPEVQSDLTQSVNKTIDNQDDLIGNIDQTLSTVSRTVRLIDKILNNN